MGKRKTLGPFALALVVYLSASGGPLASDNDGEQAAFQSPPITSATIDLAYQLREPFPDHFLRYAECAPHRSAAGSQAGHGKPAGRPWFWPVTIRNNCLASNRGTLVPGQLFSRHASL
ncbi:hypothetical protein PspTeo4_11904 [Pseudomonas sp. Teo4]|nr:hypothetical protein [Pseudomonas sp. Teo4]